MIEWKSQRPDARPNIVDDSFSINSDWLTSRLTFLILYRRRCVGQGWAEWEIQSKNIARIFFSLWQRHLDKQAKSQQENQKLSAASLVRAKKGDQVKIRNWLSIQQGDRQGKVTKARVVTAWKIVEWKGAVYLEWLHGSLKDERVILSARVRWGRARRQAAESERISSNDFHRIRQMRRIRLDALSIDVSTHSDAVATRDADDKQLVEFWTCRVYSLFSLSTPLLICFLKTFGESSCCWFLFRCFENCIPRPRQLFLIYLFVFLNEWRANEKNRT